MSLTSELRRPESPISRFLARGLPGVADLATRYGHWAGQLRKPVRPRSRGEVDWPMLGHTTRISGAGCAVLPRVRR
ncbi:hypothetical protein ACFC58_31345 [Kitasatospora purpeofusca]|uniref:hypothetical protein n=1 Tax=Kitasatospora purpeofusca TaxID=67352 RepID=UPI0035D6C323